MQHSITSSVFCVLLLVILACGVPASATVTTTGDVDPGGATDPWAVDGTLKVGNSGTGTLNVTDGGEVANTYGYIGTYADSTGEVAVTGAGSQWNNSESLWVGVSGTGTLNVTDGGVVANTSGYIGSVSGSTGEATVTGAGSQWNNSGLLYVGYEGTGTLNIEDEGLVTVGDTTSIGAAGTVNLTGGRFEFGQTTLAEFSTINATSGSMAGDVMITGVNDVASLTALQNSLVELNEVAAVNEGLLYGSAILKSSLDNRPSGELRTTASQWVRFEGDSNINASEINNFGGQVDFAQDLTNEADGEINNFDGSLVVGGTASNQTDGFIGGEGQFITNGGWTNQGVMAFSGKTHILGDVVNDTGGQIVTSGGATTTIFDDVEHNGDEIRTSSDSRTVIFGQASGAGPYTGDGTVYFEGDLRPGNSPGTVTFGGDVVLGTTSTTQIELGGLAPGEEYDQLIVRGELSLDGQLMVQLIDGYVPSDGDSFDIFDFGRLAGDFQQYDLPLLPDDLLWNTTGLAAEGILAIETAVTTLAGDFNNDGTVDAADYTLWRDGDSPDSTTAGYALWVDNFGASIASGSGADHVPEPTTLLLALLALVAAPLRVRCG